MEEMEIIIKIKIVDKCDDCEFSDSGGCGCPCRLLEVMGDENCYTIVDRKFVNQDGRLPNCPMNGGN